MPVPAPDISASRLWSRLMVMAGIGTIAGGGVNRQALSAEDRAAMAQLIGWGRARGLVPAFDVAGNLFLRLEGRDPAALPVLIGSHLDSQPTGGRFDGCYGVLAAFEAIETLLDAGLVPQAPLVLVAWMNEEGSRFAPGMMGSEVFAGRRALAEIEAVTDAGEITVGAALADLRAAFPEVPVIAAGFPLAAYLEAHIEQADLLERAGREIGIVTGIQGKKTWDVTLSGTEAHAGTEPMARRHDAVQAFARVALAMQGAALAAGEAIRFTIGRVIVRPNAPSVVPAEVVFRIDLRHPDNTVLDATAAALEAAGRAGAAPCRIAFRPMVDAPANDFDPGLRAAIAASAARRGFGAMDVLSAAGHDARHLAAVSRAAMIFVPCRGGVSHHPDEWLEPDHAAKGAQVLCDVAAGLCNAEQPDGKENDDE
ncbi:hydantoinase/carbamoylase family amidase [Sinirhodobacter populi]|uniref:Hydantoinase/carbamoylase family amidase n=1 Tax=Paenirhodobacter populi TaxID=2306993 RepID=A0A443KB07_9RHOB|nr:hydantoinase/carbamoylase family amidase [Sinirhodobacter populi]RWR29886.1 hydantoinase/carbamoylase family amidase [Sinirhodobacter populi]